MFISKINEQKIVRKKIGTNKPQKMRERKRKDEIKSNDKHDEILLFFFETTCAYTLSQIREAFLKG